MGGCGCEVWMWMRVSGSGVQGIERKDWNAFHFFFSAYYPFVYHPHLNFFDSIPSRRAHMQVSEPFSFFFVVVVFVARIDAG